MTPTPPRYAPDRPLPPYAFIGGSGLPHPRRDPEGHAWGEPEPEPPPLDPADWESSETYLFGIDLFNHGFYWEAHEQWEALWVAAGRRGPVAEFLKGLIKLAAAGVKVRQGRMRGIRSHARRAARHFRKVIETAGPGPYAGLDLEDLSRFARDIEADGGARNSKAEVVFTVPLKPR